MMESRACVVVLLDDTKLPFTIQAKTLTVDLFDLVAGHLHLKEKEYFGLYYLDETAHQQWLQSDRKVIEHEVFRKSTQRDMVTLYISVRFYIENICYLQDAVSVELYFLQARRSVYDGHIEVDSFTIFELASYSLQISHPNITEEQEARQALRQMDTFPTTTLREHPSMQYCEDQVLKRYYAMNGIDRGQALIYYMAIVEKLPTYGIHYYEVKNKQGITWWLGLSFQGIAEYDHNDKKTPRRVFPWKYLENLYFRDKKFSIEVHDPKRIVHTLSSFNLYEDAIREPVHECDDLSDAISDPTTQVSVSKRTFGPSNVHVYAWFTIRPQLTKAIWSMAVCQHQFFLDHLQNKTHNMVKQSPSEMADQLTYNPRSLLNKTRPHSTADLRKLNIGETAKSTLQLSASETDLAGKRTGKPKLSPEERVRQKELYKGLSSRKNDLQKVLEDKISELKRLCVREGEITGELPHEYTLFMAPGETTPKLKQRMGTAFSIAEHVGGKNEALTKIEMEYELQKQITKAKLKLANDETIPKNVRKKHKTVYEESHVKLKDLEERIKSMRLKSGLDSASFTSDDNFSLGGSRSVSSSSIATSSISRSPSKSTLFRSRERDDSPLSQGARSVRPVRHQLGASSASSSSLTSYSASQENPIAICHDFTPTKALRYQRPPRSHKTDYTTSNGSNDSGVNSTTSSTSLHGYSVASARPLRSGSMDDVRMAMSPQSSQVNNQSLVNRTPQPTPPSRSASRGFTSNNSYGSLERRAHRQKPPIGRLESQNSSSSLQPPKPTPQYRKSPSRPNMQPLQNIPVSNGGMTDRQITRKGPPPKEYAQNVHQTSRRMFDNQGVEPFQMINNARSNYVEPYERSPEASYTQRHYNPVARSLQLQIDRDHIAPIQIPTHQSRVSASESTGSPKESAFNFFNLSNGLSSPYASVTEESKPLELSDCMQYSEKLRRARGMQSTSTASSESIPPQPAPRRPAASATQYIPRSMSGSPAISVGSSSRSESRSGSPYIGHTEANLSQQYNQSHRSVTSIGSAARADSSFNTGDVGDDFSEEMLAWYSVQDDQTKSTLV